MGNLCYYCQNHNHCTIHHGLLDLDLLWLRQLCSGGHPDIFSLAVCFRNNILLLSDAEIFLGCHTYDTEKMISLVNLILFQD